MDLPCQVFSGAFIKLEIKNHAYTMVRKMAVEKMSDLIIRIQSLLF
jgi:hypothetical protein